MNYILKLTFFGYIIAQLAITSNVLYMEVVVLLMAVALSLYREKFGSKVILFAVEAVIIYYGITLDPIFSFLYGLMAYDMISSKYYLGLIPIVLAGIYLLEPQKLIDFFLIVSLCCIFAYMKSSIQNKEELYRSSFDKQREYSYQLEQTKARLIASTDEAAHMAEIKERNRIARQIHDNVGHSIAGIHMQLQAVRKLLNKDVDKASELLNNSIKALSDTLEVMRDTVHNIKPAEKLGIEYIRQIIDNFTYCPVEFSNSGDFTELPVNIMQILHYNIKEALTNVSKYSRATRVDIDIAVNYKYVRLQIKDNGISSNEFVEGLGLSGMKERVHNVGGTIAISSDNGFLIVCVIPINKSAEVIV
ncbi:MAG: sensor histidine kinase [Lutisporaceae bacterium]